MAYHRDWLILDDPEYGIVDKPEDASDDANDDDRHPTKPSTKPKTGQTIKKALKKKQSKLKTRHEQLAYATDMMDVHVKTIERLTTGPPQTMGYNFLNGMKTMYGIEATDTERLQPYWEEAQVHLLAGARTSSEDYSTRCNEIRAQIKELEGKIEGLEEELKGFPRAIRGPPAIKETKEANTLLQKKEALREGKRAKLAFASKAAARYEDDVARLTLGPKPPMDPMWVQLMKTRYGIEGTDLEQLQPRHEEALKKELKDAKQSMNEYENRCESLEDEIEALQREIDQLEDKVNELV